MPGRSLFSQVLRGRPHTRPRAGGSVAGALLPVSRSELGAGAWGQQVGHALGPPQQQVEVPEVNSQQMAAHKPGRSWGIGCAVWWAALGKAAGLAQRGEPSGARPVAPSPGQDTR